jgi:uncharacterized protein YjbI with pentapeptide repeats
VLIHNLRQFTIHHSQLARPPTIPQALNRYAATPVGQPGADLHGHNLNDLALVGANLSEVNLSGANLHGFDLRGVNFTLANLRGPLCRTARFTSNVGPTNYKVI